MEPGYSKFAMLPHVFAMPTDCAAPSHLSKSAARTHFICRFQTRIWRCPASVRCRPAHSHFVPSSFWSISTTPFMWWHEDRPFWTLIGLHSRCGVAQSCTPINLLDQWLNATWYTPGMAIEFVACEASSNQNTIRLIKRFVYKETKCSIILSQNS